MPDQNEERKLDDLLDSALSAYSQVEPRSGLEARILARVRDSVEQSPARWWTVRWLVAGTVAIVALVLIVLFLRPVQKPAQVEVQRTNPPAIQPQPESNRMTAKDAPGRKERRQHHGQPQQELARRDRPSVFPTPMGLSEQDKLMIAYLEQTPKEEVIAQLRAPDPKEEEEFWKDLQPAVARPQR
jgi:hypothetical protein